MKAVHFGAGNIGRGFIGYLLRHSGYDLIFVDISEKIVNDINRFGKYKVISLGKEKFEETVDDVKAIGLKDVESLTKAVIDTDLITTSIGANHLASTGKVLQKALKKRQAINPEQPTDIIACENALFATDILKKSIAENAESNFLSFYEEKIGFPNCAVDRIVPNITFKKESPVDVAVEDFFEWDLEKDAVKANCDIEGVNYVHNLAPFLERKIFLLNGAHALIAYLGYRRHYKYVHEAIKDEDIRSAVLKFHKEICRILCLEYGMDKDTITRYSEKLVHRFQNPYLQDDLTRVGRDPIRKLSHDDRLISPLLMCMRYGLNYGGIVTAVAAGLAYDYPKDQKAMEIQDDIRNNGIERTVCDVTGLENGSQPVRKIAAEYRKLLSKS